MKLTLTVEADTDDELRPYIDGPAWSALAWDFAEWLRSKQKYGETEATTFSDVAEEFYRRIVERGLNLD